MTYIIEHHAWYTITLTKCNIYVPSQARRLVPYACVYIRHARASEAVRTHMPLIPAPDKLLNYRFN